MRDRLQWQRDGRDWPHRESSRFVEAGGVRWHVQTMCSPQRAAANASLPALLLIHGTGASTHTWRGALAQLSRSFDVIAPDLPGHGFSEAPRDENFSLTRMGFTLSALLDKLDVKPTVVVGHSAGAALLARMCLDNLIAPRHLVCVNGALLPLSGLSGELFSPLAKILARCNLVPRLFSWRASDPRVLNRILRGTGSTIDDEGRRLYGVLIGNPHHAAAALEMMAQWDLRSLETDLPTLSTRNCAVTLVVGENDRTVSPNEARRVRQMLPAARVVNLPGLGHLAHEERPGQMCELIENLEMQG